MAMFAGKFASTLVLDDIHDLVMESGGGHGNSIIKRPNSIDFKFHVYDLYEIKFLCFKFSWRPGSGHDDARRFKFFNTLQTNI